MPVIVRRSSESSDLSGSFSHWFGPHLPVPAGARRSSAIVVVVRFQKRSRSAAIVELAVRNKIASASGSTLFTAHADDETSSTDRGGVAECRRYTKPCGGASASP